MFQPDSVSFLFSPLEGKYPFFFLSEDLIVRYADSSCGRTGIREGFSFLSHLPPESIVLHRRCLQMEPDTRFQIMQIPQNSLLLPLTGIEGYTLFYLEYAYAPRGTLIRASLFPGRREYRTCLLRSDRGTEPCLTRMRDISPDLTARYDGLLRAEHADGPDSSPFSMQQAVLLTAQCLTAAPDPSSPLFALREFLENYCVNVLNRFRFIDCTVDWDSCTDTPVFARLDPDRFLLLLTSVFSVLTVLAEDCRVYLSVYELGENAQLNFRIRCPSLAGRMMRCSDLQILLGSAPTKQFALTLADHIIGVSGYEPLLCGDPASGTLTLSLYLPREQKCREFKSPAHSLFLLNRALPAARGLLAWLHLLSDSQEKQ